MDTTATSERSGDVGGTAVLASIRLIVCLGNPGEDYRMTRHNAGFRVGDEILSRAAERQPTPWQPGNGELHDIAYGGRWVMLLKPMTYMNCSGEAVARVVGHFGLSPAEVLTQTNAEICSNNRNNMFVTVWFGILDLKTGRIVAANAGHEYPMIRKADGDFELFKDKHCFVIGGMKRAKYKQYEFDIEEGGTLFVYTDGAPEATNAEEQLFTTSRMIETLNRAPGVSPKELLENMKSSIDDFVAGADQFDDLTMMSIRFGHADRNEKKPEGSDGEQE